MARFETYPRRSIVRYVALIGWWFLGSRACLVVNLRIILLATPCLQHRCAIHLSELLGAAYSLRTLPQALRVMLVRHTAPVMLPQDHAGLHEVMTNDGGVNGGLRIYADLFAPPIGIFFANRRRLNCTLWVSLGPSHSFLVALYFLLCTPPLTSANLQHSNLCRE
ncbi:hypothetical protein BU23DRAFT_554939 [Bimuria novae-zelandiae CBS 107.79]|uniref:Uncharacterized protein n=1 Tax=Bimuria novae-zelandiae CBS 107.79 TaxID=1447943 RepID=A0A6A5VHJ0_9PLEO|nr:hypothetical protein BU23DRAFT_554939 [Bimuria novae-zelandiae CBS 107.79]